MLTHDANSVTFFSQVKKKGCVPHFYFLSRPDDFVWSFTGKVACMVFMFFLVLFCKKTVGTYCISGRNFSHEFALVKCYVDDFP